MGAVKAFQENVSVVLGYDGDITPFTQAVAGRVIAKECEEAGFEEAVRSALGAFGKDVAGCAAKKERPLASALLVLVIDRRIRKWLLENDPMALAQAENALLGAEVSRGD